MYLETSIVLIFTAQTCNEAGARGVLQDLPLGAHSPLGECGTHEQTGGIRCSPETQKQVHFLNGWAVIYLVDTKNNNNRLRPRGWPCAGVCLGWILAIKMLSLPWALHSYQSSAPSDSLLLSVLVPGSPGKRGHCSAQTL